MNRQLGVSAAALAYLALSATAHSEVTIFGLSTRNQLVSWNTLSPGPLQQAAFIRGTQANEAIINIDFRPATGKLYALGSFGSLYTLNTATALAT